MFTKQKQKQLQRENKQIEEQNKQLKTYYDSLETQIENTRKFHHDIRKHMDVIHTLMDNIDKKESVHTSFQHIKEQMNQALPMVYVTHLVLNAILTNKARRCQVLDIELDVEIHNFTHDYMKDSDLVILFSNLLDNAIEECQRLDTNTPPIIELKCGRHAGNIILICQNTTNKDAIHPNQMGTEKEDPFIHGLGLSIMSEMLEDYQGSLDIQITDGYFRNTILLPERIPYDNQ